MKNQKMLFTIVSLLLIINSVNILQALDEENQFENYTYHEPSEILKIISDSEIKYSIEFDSLLSKDNLKLNTEVFKPYCINPFYRLEYTNESNFILIDDTAKGEIKYLLDSGDKLLGDENYEEAMQIYEEITRADPKWFKGWTKLADCYFHFGEFEEAEKYFLKALELNEDGYQEHFYLADSYYQKGDYEKSFNHIIMAYMLNRCSSSVKALVDGISKKLNLKYIDDRLSFQINIKKISDNECLISHGNLESSNLLALSNCLAMWEMEKDFVEKYNSDSLNGMIVKYKECLTNQAIITAKYIGENKNVSKVELSLHNAIMDGYIDAIVYWDIFAMKYPKTTLLLPRTLKTKICEYIRKYCFEKISE